MASEWRVTSSRVDGGKIYAVYRLRNADGVDHSGNREYYGGYVTDRAEAARLASELNKRERAVAWTTA